MVVVVSPVGTHIILLTENEILKYPKNLLNDFSKKYSDWKIKVWTSKEIDNFKMKNISAHIERMENAKNYSVNNGLLYNFKSNFLIIF